MKRSGLLCAAAGLALAACADPSAPALEPAAPALAASPDGNAGEPIPGQYIVVFRDAVADVDAKVAEKLARSGGSLKHSYKAALKGFAAGLTAEAVAALRADADVAYVEQDQVVRAVTTQTGATWGIGRIDQMDGPSDGAYNYTSTGAGVTAYIIDTGLRTTHSEFGTRASVGTDKVGDRQSRRSTGQDCNGHGTHVGGTVGGSTYGVAKSVSLVAVRVLDCNGSGSNSGVVAGMDWVTANANLPAVANMSLGGGFSQATNDAVTRMTNKGVTLAVAAGNGDIFGRPQNACNSSPSSAASAITVGSTTSADVESSFSNYGTCVDILAPGSSITSAWYTSNTATNTISGTSMATPHVAGVAALYLSTNAGATPDQVWTELKSKGVANTITLHTASANNATPNLFLRTTY